MDLDGALLQAASALTRRSYGVWRLVVSSNTAHPLSIKARAVPSIARVAIEGAIGFPLQNKSSLHLSGALEISY